MSTTPQFLTDEQAAIQAVAAVFNGRDSSIASLQDQVKLFQQQIEEITSDDSTLAAKLNDALAQIADYQSQVARLSRPSTIYAGLEKNALFTADKKIPFQWIQPGNAGNSGGSSAATAHGTATWQPGAGANGSTLITLTPAHIAPKSDDFEFYSVLPYPDVDPRWMRWGGDFYCPTPADWGKSQQIEFQREHFGAGWQSTGAWAVNPHTGLNYWAAAGKWKVFLNASGGHVLIDLGKPTNFIAHWDLDAVNHTFTPAWIIVNGEKIETGLKPIVALPAAATRKEHSTEIQGDGQASAQPYSMVLNNHWAEWG